MYTVLLSTLAATLVAAAPSQVDVIAVGLSDPRKLTYHDGQLFVAESGLPGAGATPDLPKITFTAGISVIDLHYGDSSSSSSSDSSSSSRKRDVASSSSSSSSDSSSSSSDSWSPVRGSTPKRVVSNLDALTSCRENAGCDNTGASAVAVQGDELFFISGGSYLLTDYSSVASSAVSDNTRTLGRLLGVSLNDDDSSSSGSSDSDSNSQGPLHGVADISAFSLGSMYASGNIQGPNGARGDSNPNGLAFDADSNTFYVADAAANMIVAVHNGLMRNVAFFPPTCTMAVQGDGDAVTTGVTIGPDGFLYVSTLELRAYFNPMECGFAGGDFLGHSSIYRINPKVTGHQVTPADIFATGFSPLVDVHYSKVNEAFYAVEFGSQPFFGGGAVVEIKVKESHGQVAEVERRVLGAGALRNPGGVTTDDEGNIFVSDCTGLGACPARIVRVNY